MCGADVETIGSLVDESLVRSDGERFAMLETIREFASEALAASTEADETRRPHVAHYCDLTVPVRPRQLATPDQALWRASLEADHGNLRAAIRFSLDDGDTATALELCVSSPASGSSADTWARAGPGWTRRSKPGPRHRRLVPAR